MVKDYLTQQLILLDSIDAILDDMLALAKHHCRPFASVDDECQHIQHQGICIMNRIRHKMEMLGIL